ncbi:nucleobindin-2-like [Thrips palmi]|uniref:Nucleobindin-2-like n=1 Tax=Thrips palmi TaxID=161013 RepID=A0A6P8YK28_THRPL|nr:nucleobindin-2-like [Thrips palmi]
MRGGRHFLGRPSVASRVLRKVCRSGCYHEAINKMSFVVICLLALSGIVAYPVTETSESNAEQKDKLCHGLRMPQPPDYNPYFEKVFQDLNSDPTFLDTMGKANRTDVESGKIAHVVKILSPSVRTRLNEIKKTEMSRLQNNNASTDHIDYANPDTFEEEDLKRLIVKAMSDRNEIRNKQRKVLKSLKEESEPKSIFSQHDLDGNSLVDLNEFKALLRSLYQKEVGRMCIQGIPESSVREKWEKLEQNQQREFQDMDINKDGFINYEEYNRSWFRGSSNSQL